jgi:succinoglycan biosynthesis transport protein ExoP
MTHEQLILRNQRTHLLGVRESSQLARANPVATGDAFSIGELAGVAGRRKWLIAGCVLMGLVCALAVSLLMTPKYESVSVIEINRENSDALGLDSTTPLASDADDPLNNQVTLQTHANAIESDTLALQVIGQLRLDARPEFAWKPSRFFSPAEELAELSLPLDRAPHHREAVLKKFHKNLAVKPVSNTRMVEVHFLSPDRQVAADVVNALVNDYMDQYFLTRYTATAQASAWLSKQLADLKMQVETSQQKLVDYERQNGILGTDASNNIVMTRLEDLNKQLTDAQGERITREVINELVKTGNPELVSGLAGNSLSASASEQNSLALLQTLRTQDSELKVQYAQAATKFGEDYPTLIEMRNQLATLDSAIQEEIHKIGARADNDYLTALKTEQLLQSSFDKQKAEANNLNDKAIQYTILKHEADSSSNLYDELLEKLKSAGILSGLRSTKLLVIDPGRPGADTVHPNYLVNQGAGLAAGLFLGIGLAFLMEGSDTTVRNPDRTEAATMLPQLGLIPDFRFTTLTIGGGEVGKTRKLKTNIPMSGKWKHSQELAIAPRSSPIADAYRQVRSSLVLSEVEYPKAFLVTSPSTQEGKTTTAINLAVVFAQQGAKVLLVDADLRRPSIESRLGIEAGRGLSSILEASEGKSEATAYADQRGLFVLGAGRKVDNPAELIGSPRMTELLKQWRQRFDIIVLDSSPALAVTDPVVLSAKVDAVLVVARSGSTTQQSLMRTRDILLRANANIAGFVMNAINPHSLEYRQYYN